jgi:hypothetical protein
MDIMPCRRQSLDLIKGSSCKCWPVVSCMSVIKELLGNVESWCKLTMIAKVHKVVSLR